MERYEYSGPFFEQFPRESKSYIMNLFCQSCREFINGQPTVEELLRSVAARILRAFREGGGEAGPRAALLVAVNASLDSDEAQNVAEFVILRESIEPELKAKLKIERAAAYRERWMKEHPPTPKQLAYLKRLGRHEVPATLAEASQLIDLLVKGKKRAA